ncbi:MAG: pyruvate kinase, partial [Rikenellaceae bacterium]
MSYKDIASAIEIGTIMLIDDGEIKMTVIDKNKTELIAQIDNNGKIKNRKSVNIPNVSLDLESVTERDREFIRWAVDEDIDFIAHSFVRRKEDVIALQEVLDSYNSTIKIISKIENMEGVMKIDEILDHTYGVMVARGDLGVEIPAEQIPYTQQALIRKCVERKKPVIIATQMLQSMIGNPRPTRAEVSDIASAIFQRTDAIMLSGETANGAYPLEAVETMNRVALEIEKHIELFGVNFLLVEVVRYTFNGFLSPEYQHYIDEFIAENELDEDV